jgi:hypothetical protein
MMLSSKRYACYGFAWHVAIELRKGYMLPDFSICRLQLCLAYQSIKAIQTCPDICCAASLGRVQVELRVSIFSKFKIVSALHVNLRYWWYCYCACCVQLGS